MLFVPMWIRICEIDAGSAENISGSLFKRSEMVAPGRQCVMERAFGKWICFTMESPIIATDGGRGAVDGTPTFLDFLEFLVCGISTTGGAIFGLCCGMEDETRGGEVARPGDAHLRAVCAPGPVDWRRTAASKSFFLSLVCPGSGTLDLTEVDGNTSEPIV